jgi:hypothetical protein
MYCVWSLWTLRWFLFKSNVKSRRNFKGNCIQFYFHSFYYCIKDKFYFIAQVMSVAFWTLSSVFVKGLTIKNFNAQLLVIIIGGQKKKVQIVWNDVKKPTQKIYSKKECFMYVDTTLKMNICGFNYSMSWFSTHKCFRLI